MVTRWLFEHEIDVHIGYGMKENENKVKQIPPKLKIPKNVHNLCGFFLHVSGTLEENNYLDNI